MRAYELRRILRWLWEHHGAPKLDDEVRRYAGARPRNVTATRGERERLIAAAEPPLRLWLLLCSDLAIRSGTAARIGPEHYDPERKEIRFTTKAGERLTLPCTEAICALIEECDPDNRQPFVVQLERKKRPNRKGKPSFRPRLQRLREKLGITRRITAHDLRRTTAVALYQHTHDARDVQALLGHRSLPSTLWYLDHDLRPVERRTLELIKRPNWQKESA